MTSLSTTNETAHAAAQAAVEGAVADGAVAGAVAVAQCADGSIVSASAGERTAASGVAMTDDTVGFLASLTKAITGAAAMQLVERGVVDLDAPAGDLVPELAAPEVLEGFDDDGEPVTRAAVGTVTLRNLLTHTSGFGYDLWNADLVRHKKWRAGQSGGGRGSHWDDPLIADPDTAWAYGTGIDWAGRVVEAASGQRLDAYFDEHLFGPLGMGLTGFDLDDDKRSRLAAVHARGDDGLSPLGFEFEQQPEHFSGGAGLYGTAADYLRFLRALVNGGELDGQRILAAETVADMGRDHLGGIPIVDLTAAMPHLCHDLELYPGARKGWGLTFLRVDDDAQGRAAGTLGWAGLANCYSWWNPTNGTCGLWFSQLFPFSDPATLRYFEAFEGAINR
ncbi:MAG: serine hydrolase domain-containing protein [Acidimicrobiales bacterium]